MSSTSTEVLKEKKTDLPEDIIVIDDDDDDDEDDEVVDRESRMNGDSDFKDNCDNKFKNEEVAEEDSSVNKSYKKRNKWDVKEITYLVYFAQKTEKAWNEIARRYKKYFKNRIARDLMMKYRWLMKKKQLDQFIKLSEILENEGFDANQSFKSKSFDFKDWDNVEMVNLVYGVEKMGKQWDKILKTYLKNFKIGRTSDDLKDKYLYLEQNEKELEALKFQALFLYHDIEKMVGEN